jgi:hypothetical protein
VNSPTNYLDLKSTFAILDVGEKFVVSYNMLGHAIVDEPIKGVRVLAKI